MSQIQQLGKKITLISIFLKHTIPFHSQPVVGFSSYMNPNFYNYKAIILSW